MPLNNFVTLLKTADPDCSKNKGNGNENYTVWTPYQPLTEHADNVSVIVGYRIQVDRFTKLSDDPIVDAIRTALMSSEEVAVEEQPRDYETDTEYFHFIWICEVV